MLGLDTLQEFAAALIVTFVLGLFLAALGGQLLTWWETRNHSSRQQPVTTVREDE